MKELPLELVHRLYKANIGDVIENKYTRLGGGWMTDDDRTLSNNGFLNRSEVYQFYFKDHTDGLLYQASNRASRAIDPNYPNQNWYYEPFTVNTIDPFPVYKISYTTQAVSIARVVELITE
ncbi:hypothetical protein [Enterobacter sp. 120016]|jgi:hypothetical protein|uniref:hypothetical protein n=1 Tax=Enterobacter sp. 120016 TaxID=2834878 RepID=UPI001BD0D1D3|nr:hypothetical protein [Enterobacter sp. 120016]MBS7444009.1 hypothetical protein [Enterobacter sp. 120016]